MGLIYRTSSIANAGTSSIKNAALTYEEGDGNIAFLLTNLSGSNVSISGNTEMSGPVQVNGNIQLDGIVYMPELTSTSQTNALTYDSSTGRVYYTASSAIAAKPGGSDTHIQYNNAGAFAGDSKFKYNYLSASLMQGDTSNATGVDSFAHGTNAQAIGVSSHAEGRNTIASGSRSHAEGDNTDATANNSHAEGFSTLASGNNSHAEGNNTIASGVNSHAEGERTQAIGLSSHAAGFWTVASGSYQSVIGRYNISSSDNAAFIIGNGIDANNRSNLLFAAGNEVQITGSLRVTGSTYIVGLTSASQTNLLTYDASSGQLFFTASSAIAGDLQQTLDAGSSSLNNNILLKHSPFGIDFTEIELDVLGDPGMGGKIRVENLILPGTKIETGAFGQKFSTFTPRETTISANFTNTATSGSNTLTLPEANGTFALSVNGVGADASGNITIPTGSATNPGGSDTQIQFNSASQFGATSSFKFDYTKQVLNHGYEVNNLISGGFYSHAQGKDTYSTGDYSHAEGLGTYANSPYSHTEGRFTWVYGTASHAEGNNTKVGTRFAWSGSARFSYVTMSSEYSNIASSFNIGDRLYLYRSIGGFALVDVNKIVTESVYDPISDTTILGLDSSVGSTRLSLFVGNTQISPSFWGGGGSYIVPLNYSHTEGNNADAMNEASHAEGDSTVAYGYASHAEGSGTKTIGQYSHAEGSNTTAIGLGSHASGLGTVTNGNYQSAIGQYNISSSADAAFIIGNGADANNRSNLLFAQGTAVQITGSLRVTGSAYVIGITSASQTNILTYDTASGQLFFTASSAIGGGGTPGGSNTEIQFNSGSVFSGSAAFRFVYSIQSLEQGQSVQAIGDYSHAEGLLTQAIGIASHAEGSGTTSTGIGSHAEGDSTIALGQTSHAEGLTTTAIGIGSHAEGSNTQAIGESSHAEGEETQAIGYASHAAGWSTIASGSYQSVIGQFNISSSADSAFIIGNGADVNNRSNLLFAAGNEVQITGSLNVSGSTNAIEISNGWVILSQVSMSLNFANDAAAAAGGIPLGGLYRNGNAISIRIS